MLEDDEASDGRPAAARIESLAEFRRYKVGDKVSQGDMLATLFGPGEHKASRRTASPTPKAVAHGAGRAGSSRFRSRLPRPPRPAAPPPRPAARPRREAGSIPGCWLSTTALAATPPPSAPPIWARTSFWSTHDPDARRRLSQRRLHIPSKALLHVAKVCRGRQGDGFTRRELWPPADLGPCGHSGLEGRGGRELTAASPWSREAARGQT